MQLGQLLQPLEDGHLQAMSGWGYCQLSARLYIAVGEYWGINKGHAHVHTSALATITEVFSQLRQQHHHSSAPRHQHLEEC